MGALALATTIFEALPGFINAGLNVIGLINNTAATIKQAQAENRDPTDAEWKALDDMVSDLRAQAAAA